MTRSPSAISGAGSSDVPHGLRDRARRRDDHGDVRPHGLDQERVRLDLHHDLPGTDAVITGDTAFDVSEDSGVEILVRRVSAGEGAGAAGGRRCGRRRRRGAADRRRRRRDPVRRRAEHRLLGRPPRLASTPRAQGGNLARPSAVAVDTSTASRKDIEVGEFIGVQAEGPTQQLECRGSSTSPPRATSAVRRWPRST